MTEYIVILQQIITPNFDTAYDWDYKRFLTRKAAISHGFEIRGSDDFNIGVIKDGQLKQFCYMAKPLKGFNLKSIASKIDL